MEESAGTLPRGPRAVRSRLGLVVLAVVLGALPAAAAPFHNVILMIGDGMGPEHVKAARYYNGGPLSFETAPHQALMTTNSVQQLPDGTLVEVVTDSAASATAMATGQKVSNIVISKAIPGDTSDLPTSLEFHRDQGKSTGLVTTGYMTDATPAAFAAHSFIRTLQDVIAEDYLTESRPNVLFGADDLGITLDDAVDAGYTVVSDRAELQALDPAGVSHVSGQFGEAPPPPGLQEPMPYRYDYDIGIDDRYDTLPFLFEMTEVALAILAGDPDGFFLMVEQENTDSAGHLPVDDPLKTGRNVLAAIEFSRAVQSVLDWMAGRDDTLLIVTADHETGGLEVLGDNGAGNLPQVTWEHDDHTPVPVPVYAWGPGASGVSGLIDNTDIYRLTTMPEPGALILLLTGVLAVRMANRRATPPA